MHVVVLSIIKLVKVYTLFFCKNKRFVHFCKSMYGNPHTFTFIHANIHGYNINKLIEVPFVFWTKLYDENDVWYENMVMFSEG
jgi:hypothetical protein